MEHSQMLTNKILSTVHPFLDKHISQCCAGSIPSIKRKWKSDGITLANKKLMIDLKGCKMYANVYDTVNKNC